MTARHHHRLLRGSGHCSRSFAIRVEQPLKRHRRDYDRMRRWLPRYRCARVAACTVSQQARQNSYPAKAGAVLTQRQLAFCAAFKVGKHISGKGRVGGGFEI